MQRYQALGVRPELDAQDARHVRALNGIILIVTALLWLQLPVIVLLLPETRYILASFLLAPMAWPSSRSSITLATIWRRGCCSASPACC